MSSTNARHEQPEADQSKQDEVPGEEPGLWVSIGKYGAGLGISLLLTAMAFWVSDTKLVYAQGVPVLLAALAIGQMGVHLSLFLHISSGPEGTNNILALAFGVFVVALVVFGSIIIMANLDTHMMPMERLLQMQK